jgi:alkyl sulfatase BDS1-like metallo-beta-lactamase superfamily hydrolase
VITAEECDRAIHALAARLGADGGEHAGGLDRSVSATITDLGRRYRGHLHDGVLDDIREDDDGQAPAQIRLTMASEDLLALANGQVSLGSAWLSGRLKVHASFPDMLRLRAMM